MKKPTPFDVVFGWSIDAGPDPGKVTLGLRHQKLEDLRAKRPGTEKRTVLVLLEDQARALSDDLSGKTAATRRETKFDS